MDRMFREPALRCFFRRSQKPCTPDMDRKLKKTVAGVQLSSLTSPEWLRRCSGSNPLAWAKKCERGTRAPMHRAFCPRRPGSWRSSSMVLLACGTSTLDLQCLDLKIIHSEGSTGQADRQRGTVRGNKMKWERWGNQGGVFSIRKHSSQDLEPTSAEQSRSC